MRDTSNASFEKDVEQAVRQSKKSRSPNGKPGQGHVSSKEEKSRQASMKKKVRSIVEKAEEQDEDTSDLFSDFKLLRKLRTLLRFLSPSRQEIEQKLTILRDLQTALGKMYLTVEVYGSLRTGLLVPTSDIDCVMKIEDKSKVAYILQRVAYCCGKYKGVQTARESKQAFAGGVRFIGNVLRGSGVFRQVTCIAHAKVPIVKCVHRGDSIKVDLSFEEDGCESSDFLCAQFQKEKFRLARGLIILVKSLLANFSLDDPSVGGLGSFPTSILVLYYLRAVVHEHYPVELRDNMAVIFVGFLKYYGNEQFDYRRECINFREGKTFTKAPSSDLYIENPVKPGTNCSRSATLYASKVVPKFSEAAEDFSVLLEQDVKDRQVESVLEEYFGRCIPQVSHWDQVERRAENKPLVPQHQWDPKTNVYIGGVLD